ncbi:MAG: GAF domain-containing protein [Anaerolineae bacterium]|nr:GAF domain-containing protein [Anaerolineae bacterium]
MAKMTLEAYKKLVETQGRALLNFIQSVAMGDLDVEVEVPEGIEVLSDLAVGIQMMIDDLRDMMRNETQSRLIERQSRALLSVVQSVALGDLDIKIDVPEGVEELSELAIGIEMMVDDIRTMLEEQEQARAEIEASRQQLEATLEEMRAVQQRYIQQEWSGYAATAPGYVYNADADAPQPLAKEALPETWLATLNAALTRGETVVTGEEDEVANTLALPITWAGETIGVLGLNRQAAATWDDEDRAVVDEIVEYVGWALENQRLFEEALRARSLLSKQVRELDCLNDIGRKIAESPPIPELLQWTAERIPEAMQHADVCLAVIEYGGRFYGDIDAVDLSRQMVAGMRIGDELIGRVLVAYREDQDEQAHPFLDSESAMLGDVTRRLTGYIENQRLLEQTESRARQEQALLQISAAIGGSEDLEAVIGTLPALIEPLRELAPVDLMSLATYTPGENEVAVFAVVTETDVEHFSPPGTRLPLEGSAPGWVITHERQWLQDDMRKKPTFAEDMHLIAEGVVSRLLLPLHFGERTVGTLNLASLQPATFTPERAALLTQVANQLAQAIERARLLASTRAALAAEAETRRSYERREWETYLQENRRLRQNTFVYDQGELTLASDFWRPEMQRALREAVLATSVQARNEEEPAEQPTDSDEDKRVGLAVPIEMRGQVIGVLGVEDPEGEWRSSADQLALIQSVAQQLGQALESARLLEDTQRRAAREERTRQITDNIRAAPTIEEAVKRAVQEIGRVLNASEMVARLGTENLLLPHEEGTAHE